MKVKEHYIVKSLLHKECFCLLVKTEEERWFLGEETNLYTFFEVHPNEAIKILKQ